MSSDEKALNEDETLMLEDNGSDLNLNFNVRESSPEPQGRRYHFVIFGSHTK